MAAKASITPAGLAAAPKAAAQAFMAASPVIKVGLPSSMARRAQSKASAAAVVRLRRRRAMASGALIAASRARSQTPATIQESPTPTARQATAPAATRVGSCRLTDPPSWPRWSVEPAPASDPGRACWPTRGPHASPTAPLPSYRGPCQVAVNRIGEGLIMQTHVLVAIVTLVALLLYFM